MTLSRFITTCSCSAVYACSLSLFHYDLRLDIYINHLIIQGLLQATLVFNHREEGVVRSRGSHVTLFLLVMVMMEVMMTFRYLVHMHSDVISHVLLNVAEEQGANDAQTSKGQRDVVNPGVALCICDLAGKHERLVCGCVIPDLRKLLETRKETNSCDADNRFDLVGVGNVEFVAGRTEILDGIRNELLSEHVVINSISNGAA